MRLHFWKKKKQDQCIKHKLWGKLKLEAHKHYRIAPVYSNDKYYVIEYWCVDHYSSLHNPEWYSFNDAKKRIVELREEKFHKLCCEALYYRRLARTQNY